MSWMAVRIILAEDDLLPRDLLNYGGNGSLNLAIQSDNGRLYCLNLQHCIISHHTLFSYREGHIVNSGFTQP
jgi:hypothetical protein